MADLLSTKNTLNITYNYDKTNQRSGYFTLDLRQDNKTYVPKQLDANSVTYYKEGGYEIKTWPANLVNGEIVLQATDFPDLRKAGTYVIRATVDGILFPSQGKCTLTLNGDFSSDTPVQTQVIAGHDGADGASVTNVNVDENGLMTVTLDNGKTFTSQIRLPEAVKGDRGEKGENGLSAYQLAQQAGFKGSLEEWLQSLKGKDGLAGKNAAEITTATITGKTLTFKLSDNSSYSVELPLLKGERGDAGLPGKDAPKITGVTLNDDQTQIIFTMSDGTRLESSFKAPTAIPGKDAPKIASVSYKDNQLVFTLSDKSTISATLPDLTGPKGDRGSDGLSAYQIAVSKGFKGSEQDWLNSLKGDAGIAGQNAPKITSVKFENNQLTFTLSDQSSVSTPLTLPKGDKGNDGKDAPKFTNVNYQNGELVFTLSDNSTISTPLTLPKGDNGTPGKDAPKINNASITGKTLTFKLSDNSSYSVELPLLKGGKGDAGLAGKDAPKITKASYADGTLTFTLSDNSTISTPLKIESASDQVSGITFSTTPYSPKYTNDPQNLIVANLKYASGKTKSFPIAGDHPDDSFTSTYISKIADDTGLLPSLVSRNHDHFTIETTTMNPGLYQRNGKFVMVDMNGSMGNSSTISFKPIFDEIDAKKETMFVADSDPNFKKIDWHITSVSANSDNFSQVTRLFFLLSPTVVYIDPQTEKPFAQPKIAVPTITYPQETVGAIIDSSTFEIYYQIWDLDSMPLNSQPTFFDPSAYSTTKSDNLIFFGNRQSILSCSVDPSKIPSDKQEQFKLIKPQPFDTSVNLYLHFK